MTPAEFALRAMSPAIPWRKWASGWDACDCYGLVLLYFREVIGLRIGDVPQTDIAAGFALPLGWRECGAEPGATAWMAWRDGGPTHCGVLLPGDMLIHCEGSDDRPGSARVTRLPAMLRMRPDIRFYRHELQGATC